MGTNPPTPQPLPALPSSSSSVGAEAEYKSLLSLFKNLVWISGIGLSVITVAGSLLVAIGSYFFWANIRDVRQDAKDQAERVAKDEAQRRVSEAFEEKNVQAVILKAAQEKVGTITDRMIEQQLNSKLQPIQQRILLIGRISECEARIHLAYRSALEELTTIMNETHDADARQFAHSTLITTSQGYDTFWQPIVAQQTNMSPFDKVRAQVERPGQTQVEVVKDLGGVVRVINQNQDLNAVAVATIVFRGLTGNKDLKMFDFKAVNAWCASHEPQCK